jgi:hypothetical protein
MRFTGWISQSRVQNQIDDLKPNQFQPIYLVCRPTLQGRPKSRDRFPVSTSNPKPRRMNECTQTESRANNCPANLHIHFFFTAPTTAAPTMQSRRSRMSRCPTPATTPSSPGGGDAGSRACASPPSEIQPEDSKSAARTKTNQRRKTKPRKAMATESIE